MSCLKSARQMHEWQEMQVPKYTLQGESQCVHTFSLLGAASIFLICSRRCTSFRMSRTS